MKKHLFIFALSGVLFACQAPQKDRSEPNLTQYVNPFIGTGGHGHTFPGATMPFGMVQLSPDTRLDGWDGCSGYHFSDSVVYGFSHTHLSGTGVSDYGDILLMPSTSRESVLDLNNNQKSVAVTFNKSKEIAEPGFYSTYLTDENILVELTSTLRAGLHKYTFKKGTRQVLKIDLEHRDQVTSAQFDSIFPTVIQGHRVSNAWAKEQHVYFSIHFSKNFFLKILAEDSLKIIGVEFSNHTKELLVKIGISAVSIANAEENLQAEIPHWDFEKTKAEASEAWNKQLSKIEVEGEENDKVKFYTSLYHTMIAPNLYTDVNGDYRGMDMKIHNIGDGKEQYTVFSLWDTFRATHPLYTLIEQDRTNAFIQTFLRQYQQGGLLPVWELAANETYCMIGYHSVSVIADAYVKGLRDYDENLALKAMVNSANQDHHGLEFYKKQGCINAGDESESVSKTLAYAYDDWCIAEMASALSETEIANTFYKRSENWKNLYDAENGFFRARVNNGWFSPFRPDEVNFNYTEANAWQYSLFVPHDIYGLQSLKPKGLDPHLNLMFRTSSETTGREQADITGLIGQYAHGNEPSHHMAYLYNYCGRPDQTQKLVYQIKEQLYTTEPDGLSGNEDCGQMSAWYVLSAMGFYSVTPGQPYYAIGQPTFNSAKINLENGKTFTIQANGLTKDYWRIQSATLNGEPYNKTYISHQTIMEGGVLVFEMGQLVTDWGKEKEAWPPQNQSRNELIPTPYFTTEINTFKDSLRVGVGTLCQECEIFMSILGEEGTWEKKDSLWLKADTEIWAFAQHPNGKTSDTIFTPYLKLDDKLKLSIHSEYANQYSAGGDNALMDRQYGTANFRTGSWQGYQGQDFEAILDLGERRNGAEISIGFLQDTKSWIWFPEKVEFQFSIDGIHWGNTFGKGQPTSFERQEGARTQRLSQEFQGKVRFIKIVAKSIGPCPDWHLGAGGKSWIFIDEIEVK